MLLPEWSIAGLVLVFIVAVASGYLGAIVAQRDMRSTLYSLQNEVIVLETTLTTEIKRRAALMKLPREKDDELLDKLAGGGTGQPKRQPFWWEQFTGQNQTGG